jgi:hypothetical protein
MIALGDVAIMGGGCYGTFYLEQLESARARGAATIRQVLVVDHDAGCQAAPAIGAGSTLVVADWGDFLDRWLGDQSRDRDGLADTIVPTPLMPHLLAQWLERAARNRWPDRDVALVAADEPLGTPFDRLGADGVRYVSFADWICPMHCVEPLICPMIKAPRTWEMEDSVTDWTTRHGASRPTAGPALFTCRHAVYGVGMYPACTATEAFDAFVPVASDDAGGDLVIGSISACHGAIALLRVGPAVRAVAA